MAAIQNIEGVELSSSSSNSRYGKRDDSVVIKLESRLILVVSLRVMPFKLRL